MDVRVVSCVSYLSLVVVSEVFFFFKQKTAYEVRISDCSSNVCSSDLGLERRAGLYRRTEAERRHIGLARCDVLGRDRQLLSDQPYPWRLSQLQAGDAHQHPGRSEEHTSELQSLMRTSYAVFCLKNKKHLPGNRFRSLTRTTDGKRSKHGE